MRGKEYLNNFVERGLEIFAVRITHANPNTAKLTLAYIQEGPVTMSLVYYMIRSLIMDELFFQAFKFLF